MRTFFNGRIKVKSITKNIVYLIKYLTSLLIYFTFNKHFSSLIMFSLIFLVKNTKMASPIIPEKLSNIFQRAKNTPTTNNSKMTTSLVAHLDNSSHIQTKIIHTSTSGNQASSAKLNEGSHHLTRATQLLKFPEVSKCDRGNAIYREHVFPLTEVMPQLCKLERSRNFNRVDNEKIEAKLVSTDDPCLKEIGKNAQLLYVKRGDNVDLKICFDAPLSKTYYVKYEIDGAIMSQIDKPDERPTKFLVGENKTLFPDHVACFYTKSHQKALFEDVYTLPDRINTTSFMAKGHLASNGDFVSAEQKEGTFYFANITPQWQSINMKTWSQIEASVRRLAKKKKSKLTVYTGTHGQMTINKNPIYLTTNKRIPVPKWLWKAVIDNDTSESIGFTCTNDPFSDLEPICGSREYCEEINWKYFGKTKSSGKGYCCTLEELKAAIPEASEIVEKSNGILRGPLLSIHAASMLKIQVNKARKKVAKKLSEEKNNKKNVKITSDVKKEQVTGPSKDSLKKSPRTPSRKKKPIDSDPDYSYDETQ